MPDPSITSSRLPGHYPTKCFYFGNLDIPYFDWDLLIQLINENPKIDFCLAGKLMATHYISLLGRFPNAHYLGVLSQKEIQSYMVSAQILIVIYKADQFVDQLANPHKIMTYLTSGKVIVATQTTEFADFGDLIPMSLHNREYADLFKSVVSSLDYYNSQVLTEERKSIAFQNSYSNQVAKIDDIVSRMYVAED
jgi:hypothetical protein